MPFQFQWYKPNLWINPQVIHGLHLNIAGKLIIINILKGSQFLPEKYHAPAIDICLHLYYSHITKLIRDFKK